MKQITCEYGRGASLAKIKDSFIKMAPEYKSTLYPADDSKGSASLWAHDPNNDKFKHRFGMAWPPGNDREDKGQGALAEDRDEEEEAVGDEQPAPTAKLRSRKRFNDPAYQTKKEGNDEDIEGEDDVPQRRTQQKTSGSEEGHMRLRADSRRRLRVIEKRGLKKKRRLLSVTRLMDVGSRVSRFDYCDC